MRRAAIVLLLSAFLHASVGVMPVFNMWRELLLARALRCLSAFTHEGATLN